MEEYREKDTDQVRSKIATLIFMDLETTGLPCDVGKKNVHITEMCMVAVDRNNFEDDRNLRVLNKLNLCIRPRSVVSHGAMAVTGLYNDILDDQEEFDDSIPKLLEYFFRRLQSPICLLAHNGKKFDFPVFQAELKRLNYSLNSNILCADTLEAFRSICLSHKQGKGHFSGEKTNGEKEHATTQVKTPNGVQLVGDNQQNVAKAPEDFNLVGKTRGKEVHPVSAPISEADIDALLSQDLESFTCMDISLEPEKKEFLKPEISEIPPTKFGIKVDDMPRQTNETESSEFLASVRDEKTPPKSKIPSNFGEKCIPKKRKIFNHAAHENGHKKQTVPVKRTLFPKQDPLPLSKITRFSLENLYNHFFHEDPPNSHFAEIDCISLSKVCQKINQEFLQWVDENSVAFSSINSFW